MTHVNRWGFRGPFQLPQLHLLELFAWSSFLTPHQLPKEDRYVTQLPGVLLNEQQLYSSKSLTCDSNSSA